MPEQEPSVNASKAPPLIQNWISLTGVILAGSAFFAVILLIIMDLTSRDSSAYVGILTYLVAPAFLVSGLLLIAVGVVHERRRRRRLAPGEIPRYPSFDLNKPGQRRNALVVSVVTVVFLLLTAVGAYQTFHFTESVRFCGETCHSVMNPEFTAYQSSPHARVTCVQCHIGPGAGWFVKSKLSGVYQVYATLADVYPRPIPTPIENLRPAQETCEQCHWPLQFYSNSERVNVHYRRNETNDPWTIRLLMKIGGGDPAMREVSGIHWHVSPTNQVEYIATDHSRQEIPWVKVTEGDGRVTIYQLEDGELTPEQVDSATPRSMDCIDCHNRPSHIYRAASRAVNHAMNGNRISTELPFIKRNAVEWLTAEYESTPEALQSIENNAAAEYGDLRDPAVVQRTSEELQTIYSSNFFPEMKVDWRAYPNNVGHTLFPGCYRCHDGKHTSSDGRVISHDCTTCHVIIGQGPDVDSLTVSPEGLEFEHPTDIMGMWRSVNCAVCHAGGSM